MSITLLVVSILTIILSSWAVHTFRLLKKNMDDNNFSVCNVDKDSVKRGHVFASLMLTVSILLLLLSSYSIYLNMSGAASFKVLSGLLA